MYAGGVKLMYVGGEYGPGDSCGGGQPNSAQSVDLEIVLTTFVQTMRGKTVESIPKGSR